MMTWTVTAFPTLAIFDPLEGLSAAALEEIKCVAVERSTFLRVCLFMAPQGTSGVPNRSWVFTTGIFVQVMQKPPQPSRATANSSLEPEQFVLDIRNFAFR